MVLSIATLFMAGALAAVPEVGAMSLSELAARAQPSVVSLELLDRRGEVAGSGSGFFVSSDGLVATNDHVIEGAERIRASLSDGRKLMVAGVLARDFNQDVAIVKIEGKGFPALSLGDSTALGQGTGVVVIGSPLGFSGTLSEGIVSAIRDDGLPERFKDFERKLGRLLQVTAPISPGSSGSPVMTFDGKVIGIAQSTFVGAQNLNFAIPVEVIAKLRASIPEDAAPEPFHKMPLHNLVASAIFLAFLVTVIVVTRPRRRRKKGLRSAG